MVATAPTYSTILATTVAAMQATAVQSVGGQSVLLDMAPGSHNLALATAVAVNVAALFARQDAVQAAVLIASAAGTDLDNLVALLGVTRNAAVAATKPVLIGRQQVAQTAIQVLVGWPFSIQTAQGPVQYTATQGQSEPPGVALTVQAGSQYGWLYGQAVTPGVGQSGPSYAGVIGNTPTNLPAQFGQPLVGLDTLLNPPAGVPSVPSATVGGTPGSSTRYYRLVGHGATGTTLPGPVLTVSNAANPPSNTNNVALSWTFGTDGGAVQPVSYDVLVSTDSVTWGLLANTTGTTYTDTGLATTPYTLPLSDTSNWGTGGADAESDAALRQRAPTEVAAKSGGTAVGVAAAVAQVAGVASAVGIDSSPGSGTVNVVTTAYPPAASVTAGITTAVAQSKALGAQITASVIVPTAVNVTYSIVVSGTVADPTTLYSPVESAITTYLAGLALGAPVHFSAVISAMMAVSGVVAVAALTLNANGTNYTGSDVPGSPLVVYRAGTYTHSASH